MRIKERYQLAAELGERYWAAGRRERSALLDAFCLTTGYSRKYAISVLRGRQRKSRSLRKPHRRRYGKAFQAALGVIWEAAGYICAERLRPFLPDLLLLLESHRQLSPAPETKALLLAASTSTLSRNLVQLRQQCRWPRRSLRPPTRLNGEVPIRVRSWRQELRPGYLEVDLVSHSGRWAVVEQSGTPWLEPERTLDMSRARPYRVYVIELVGMPGQQSNERRVHVGQSAKTPEERFLQHKNGRPPVARPVVKRYGTRLLPKLYAGVGPFTSRALAETAELDLAEDLRRRGYVVHGKHGEPVAIRAYSPQTQRHKRSMSVPSRR